MAIRGVLAYHGFNVAGVYIKIKSFSGDATTLTGTAWGWKDKATSQLPAEALSPAFYLTATCPYVQGGDVFALLYAALKLDPTLSNVVDALD